MQRGSDTIKLVGKRVHYFRTQKKITLEELSSQSGIDYSYICRIESGKTNPSLNKLLSICIALNINIQELFDFELINTNTINFKEEINNIVDKLSNTQLHNFYQIALAYYQGLNNQR